MRVRPARPADLPQVSSRSAPFVTVKRNTLTALVLRSRFSIPADSVLYQAAGPAVNGASSSLRDGYNAAQRRGSGPNGFASNGLPSRSATPDYKGKGRASDDYLALDMGGPPANGSSDGQQMQMQAYAPQQQDQYLGQRATAIESIESTIQELGQIFTQLATMVAQQGETVQRIDADTSDIAK